jgi:hypothetical protein
MVLSIDRYIDLRRVTKLLTLPEQTSHFALYLARKSIDIIRDVWEYIFRYIKWRLEMKELYKFGFKTTFLVLPSSTYLFTAGVEVVYFHLITLRHAPQLVGLLWTRDRPVAETSTWQHKYCTRRTSMPPVEFEPTIPASARPQTYVLDRAITGITGFKISVAVFVQC